MRIITLKWSNLTPETHFVQFYLSIASYFLFISWANNKECDTGNEAVMKTHKKIEIGMPEIGTFSAVTAEYSEFEAEILKLWYDEKILLPVEPLVMRMQWEHTWHKPDKICKLEKDW